MEISTISEQAMSYFLHWRHQIDVPAQSFEILQQLKSCYKLVAMTNGNVEPARIGFHHFDLTLRGGEHGRAKPHEDLGLFAILKESKQKMKGHKMTLFVQNLSFFWWGLGVFATGGLLGLYVTPYVIASNTIFATEVLGIPTSDKAEKDL